jgi:hypothetical protein
MGLFSLASGALLESASGSLREHETTLFRRLWEKLRGGDVLLADRGFCSYVNLAALAARGVDSLMRLHAMRPVDFRRGQRLGHDDRLAVCKKPSLRPEGWSEAEFDALPETLSVRLIRLQVAAKGFRTKTVVLATSLTDPLAHPADALRALYAERWRVEGHFFQIKELLALDVLRCKSPALSLSGMRPSIGSPTTWCARSCNATPRAMEWNWGASASRAAWMPCTTGARPSPPQALRPKSRKRSSSNSSPSSRVTQCPNGPDATNPARKSEGPRTIICLPDHGTGWATCRTATGRAKNSPNPPYLSAIRACSHYLSSTLSIFETEAGG